MRLTLTLAAGVLMLGAGLSPGWAACTGRFVRDAGNQFDPEKVQRRGADFGRIAQLNVDRKTGQSFFCGDSLGCYPSSAISIAGACRIVPSNIIDENEVSLNVD